jgi:enoyl-CoA hydratase/carnithine racemase
MSEPLVLLSSANGIAHMTLNRPQARNALSEDMLAAIKEAIDTVNGDPNLRVVVIDANGPGFCAGHDLKEMNAHRADEDAGKAYFEKLFATCCDVMLAVVESPKIFIAKIHGIATAAGCQLVAACDMAIASDIARFGVNGINAGLFCSTPMVSLSRNAGRKAAMELLTTGQLMGAEEAERANIINRVVACDDLDSEVDQMAEAVAAKPAAVLALGKQAFYQQLEMPLEQAYAHTSKVIAENMMMEDAREGICAFIEKRQPNWD